LVFLGGERVYIFGKFLVKGWGEPFLGRGEKRNGEKLNKTVSFDHFLDMYGRKTLKKFALMTHLGLFLSLFTYFLRFSQFMPFFGNFL
jgi:hypothetical protein